jgi:hypothetical protein
MITVFTLNYVILGVNPRLPGKKKIKKRKINEVTFNASSLTSMQDLRKYNHDATRSSSPQLPAECRLSRLLRKTTLQNDIYITKLHIYFPLNTASMFVTIQYRTFVFASAA